MASRRETERRKVDASYLEVAAFCHATEDCSRVEESVKRVFPPNLRSEIKLSLSQMEGYYGNPIGSITARVENREQVYATIKYLSDALEPLEKALLRSTFDLRYDSKSKRLIIRLSKQELYLGKFKVSDSDDIVKVVIGLKNARSVHDAISFFTSSGLIT